MFVSQHNNVDLKCTCDYTERCHVLSEQINSQYLYGYKSISMEIFALGNFNKLKPYTIPMEQFNYNLSDESYQDDSTTETHILFFFNLFLKNK